MAELLATIIAFPAVIPTVLLGVALLYWLMVLLGAVDIDLFSADGAVDGVLDGAAEGASHGLLEGAADGAAEGAMDGAMDGVADGAMDGVADGVADGAADGASEAIVHVKHAGLANAADLAGQSDSAAGLLSIAHFRSVPVTVTFSLIIVFSWLFCVTALGLIPAFGLPSWIFGTGVLAASFLVSLLPTAVLIRPLGGFFKVHDAKSHRDMVGRICRITTGSVGPKFGQARLETEDLDLIVQVRSEHSDLKRTDRALIVAWDPKQEAFLVEPYDKLMED